MIIFDTETTGLDSAINNICQLSYIKVYDFERSKPMEICSAKNFFFTVDYVEPGAEKVHGLSVDKLRELSKCKRFKDFAEEIYEDFKNEDIFLFTKCRTIESENVPRRTISHVLNTLELRGQYKPT